MMPINLCAFLLCVLMFVFCIHAQRFDYFQSNNYRALSGRAFGEGVLRPGRDQGEGYLTELDAPLFSAPQAASSRYYG